MNYKIQSRPDEVAFMEGGNRFNPILTLKDEYGGVSHIFEDDGCYVLAQGSKGGKFNKVYHWYPEAVDALKSLPTLPIKPMLNGETSE